MIENFSLLVFDDISGFMICCYVLGDEEMIYILLTICVFTN